MQQKGLSLNQAKKIVCNVFSLREISLQTHSQPTFKRLSGKRILLFMHYLNSLNKWIEYVSVFRLFNGFFSPFSRCNVVTSAVEAICPFLFGAIRKLLSQSIEFFFKIFFSLSFGFSVFFSHFGACVCIFISFFVWCNRDLSVEKVIWTRVQHPIKKTGILKGYSY